MTESGHSRRLGVGQESAGPSFRTCLAAVNIRRDVPQPDPLHCNKRHRRSHGYLITSSASNGIELDNLTPNALAVLAGFPPLRI
jgi:hypothetical protein